MLTARIPERCVLCGHLSKMSPAAVPSAAPAGRGHSSAHTAGRCRTGTVRTQQTHKHTRVRACKRSHVLQGTQRPLHTPTSLGALGKQPQPQGPA